MEKELQNTFVKQIQDKKDDWLRARRDSEYAKHVADVMFDDYVEAVKRFTTTWDYRIPTIVAARAEIGKKTKKERKNLLMLQDWIKTDFIKDFSGVDVNITDIIGCGLESTYYYSIYFDLYAMHCAIHIPSRRVLTTENFHDAYGGKFAFLHQESEALWSVECTAYTEEELANQIQDFLKEVFDTEKERKD